MFVWVSYYSRSKKKKKIKKKILFFSLLVGFFFFPAITNAAGFCDFMANIEALITNIGGSIVIVGWIIAGILYLTSAGSPEKTGTAKKAMIAAVIGTVLVILAAGAAPLIKDAIGSKAELYRCQ